MSDDYASRARDLAQSGDVEGRHIRLDELLCEALEEHGEEELVEVFRDTGKWYA
jgi:hypothetical protein